jgi:hypothetical protein
VSTTGGNNEVFRFVPNDYPVVSTEEDPLWMTIRNARANNRYLTDAVSTEPVKNFTLRSLDAGSQAQQWQMIAKGNGRVEIINRATGNIISTTTNLNKYFFLDSTTDPETTVGWSYAQINSSPTQYEVFTTSDGGIVSYWNATVEGQAPEVYMAGNTGNSAYAWIFSWVAKNSTDLNSPVIREDIRVYSQDRRIYVVDCDEYRITTIYGVPVPTNVDLPAGIYLVTAKGITKKVLVK